MLKRVTAEVVERVLTVIAKNASSETNKIGAVLKEIAHYPLKVLAAFVFSPILLLIVVWTGGKKRNFIVRIIAVVGLFLSLILTYLVGLLLGSWAGTFLIADNIGILTAIGFLIGTTVSVYLSVAVSIMVFNAVCYIFLKMSSEEVVDHLRDLGGLK